MIVRLFKLLNVINVWFIQRHWNRRSHCDVFSTSLYGVVCFVWSQRNDKIWRPCRGRMHMWMTIGSVESNGRWLEPIYIHCWKKALSIGTNSHMRCPTGICFIVYHFTGKTCPNGAKIRQPHFYTWEQKIQKKKNSTKTTKSEPYTAMWCNSFVLNIQIFMTIKFWVNLTRE